MYMLKVLSFLFGLILFFTLQVSHAESITYEFAESSRSIMRVGPNQSLNLLVEQIYPDSKKHWPQIKEKIKSLNPHAFSKYTGRIIPGQRLKLVTVKKIRELSANKLYQVGSINSVKGYAVVTDKYGKEGRLTDKSDVYEGDRVTTSMGAQLVIKMIDGAEMHIKQDSSVRITEYAQKSGFESGSRSIIDLIKGGLRKITGAIGANPLSIYRFHTGVMTIGVRGTDYVVKLCQENDCEQSAGRNDSKTRLHVVVLDGLITLQDEEGVQGELALGQYAVVTTDTKVVSDDANPVKGLLSEEEQAIFDKTQPPEKGVYWPWIIGGALFGI